MTSDKQARANQQNARKSTGPKTPEGKAAVRHNALTHGLLAQEVLLPGEDGAIFKELGKRLWLELEPKGDLESLLVDKIIVTHWRLRCLGRLEAGLFAPGPSLMYSTGFGSAVYVGADNAGLGSTFTQDAKGANAFSKLSRYETTLERRLYRALHELQRLQAARRAENNVPPPVAVDVDVSGLPGGDL